MEKKENYFKDYEILAEYLYEKGKIKNLLNYKFDFKFFLLHARHLISYEYALKYTKNKNVLSIGCFIGYGEEILASNAKKVVAIDEDLEAINFAKKTRSKKNIEFKKIDALELPFKENTFDVITAFQLIEHIQPNSLPDFLEKMKSLLKPGGLLIITTPNRKFRLLPFQKPFNPEHFQEFTKRDLEQVLRKNFQEFNIYGLRAKKWIQLIEKYRVKRGILLLPIKMILKIIIIITKPRKGKKGIKENVPKFKKKILKILMKRFKLSHFYLNKKRIDSSMTFFAICKNTSPPSNK